MRGVTWAVVVVMASWTADRNAGGGQEEPASTAAVSPQQEGAAELNWMTDYGKAMDQAGKEKKMLFVYFEGDRSDDAHDRFQSETLADAEVRRRLRDHVLLRVPLTGTVTLDGEPTRLLDHKSFHYMYGRGGVAIVDLKHEGRPYYGYVVACFPFDRPAYYCPSYESVVSIKTILDLPPGTITQRTMVYAVRMHPESPASTVGRCHPILQNAASQHSRHQARIRLQGHHGWEGRFQRIWGRLRGGAPPTEVCAQSWPGPGLVGACLDCVNSWRQSPGHWSAVRSRQPGFGYDIRRGSDGIWYATGIFGG